MLQKHQLTLGILQHFYTSALLGEAGCITCITYVTYLHVCISKEDTTYTIT
jgi:hypothetical protein